LKKKENKKKVRQSGLIVIRVPHARNNYRCGVASADIRFALVLEELLTYNQKTTGESAADENSMDEAIKNSLHAHTLDRPELGRRCNNLRALSKIVQAWFSVRPALIFPLTGEAPRVLPTLWVLTLLRTEWKVFRKVSYS
jgi:hypothetical protein